VLPYIVLSLGALHAITNASNHGAHTTADAGSDALQCWQVYRADQRLLVHTVRHLHGLQLWFRRLRYRAWKLQRKCRFKWVLLLGQRRLQLRNAAHGHVLSHLHCWQVLSTRGSDLRQVHTGPIFNGQFGVLHIVSGRHERGGERGNRLRRLHTRETCGCCQSGILRFVRRWDICRRRQGDIMHILCGGEVCPYGRFVLLIMQSRRFQRRKSGVMLVMR
jgi:hypothetical protein